MRGKTEGLMVEVSGLVRRYGDLTAASDVSFTVERGEMFGLIGPDGAGKTTTLRVILGLLAPHEGRVRTCGLDPWSQTDELSKRIGYLSQRFSLYGDLTVDENIEFFAEIHRQADFKARREERLLAQRFGDAWSSYAARVPGWFPGHRLDKEVSDVDALAGRTR